VKEHGLTIVATLNDMQRHSRNGNSRDARHAQACPLRITLDEGIHPNSAPEKGSDPFFPFFRPKRALTPFLLASTDADTVYAHTHRHKDRYIDKLGFRMYEFKPFPVDAPDFFPRWPLHSKSFVVDGRVALIGSHNFDPRSEGFNTENGLLVWDEDFAQTLERLIRRDIEPQNSWVVAMRPDWAQQQTAIETPPGNNTEFLPWFYGSTSVYELAPDKEPVPPGSADFYRHYFSVGSFPEVIRTRRQINVLFLGSFFFLEPIL
jgi:hypothetical protein